MGTKITIELPEWAEERIICILAGVEMLAFKPAREDKLYIKETKCNECGKCCMSLDEHVFPTINGCCVHLKKRPGLPETYHCALGGFRPYMCCTNDPVDMEECCITHRVEDIDS